MNRVDRIDMWEALALEASGLVRDFEASLFVDADHAQPSLAMRMSALRGQTRGLVWNQLPLPTWTAAKAFAWAASQFVDPEATPLQRRERGPALIAAADQLLEVLADVGRGRRRADLDD